ncbi:hypothetical protein PG994_010948 [Apiospora phragmitis]|uniref:Uncharacterized protein n=1 Tax=Apiospora phragmitis TaxID=2905665 RepID=A0ABR1TU34_9PEZI
MFMNLGYHEFDWTPGDNEGALAAFPRFDRHLRAAFPRLERIGVQVHGPDDNDERHLRTWGSKVGALLGYGDQDEGRDPKSRVGSWCRGKPPLAHSANPASD